MKATLTYVLYRHLSKHYDEAIDYIHTHYGKTKPGYTTYGVSYTSSNMSTVLSMFNSSSIIINSDSFRYDEKEDKLYVTFTMTGTQPGGYCVSEQDPKGSDDIWISIRPLGVNFKFVGDEAIQQVTLGFQVRSNGGTKTSTALGMWARSSFDRGLQLFSSICNHLDVYYDDKLVQTTTGTGLTSGLNIIVSSTYKALIDSVVKRAMVKFVKSYFKFFDKNAFDVSFNPNSRIAWEYEINGTVDSDKVDEWMSGNWQSYHLYEMLVLAFGPKPLHNERIPSKWFEAFNWHAFYTHKCAHLSSSQIMVQIAYSVWNE